MRSILKNLFKKGEAPLESVTHPVLGTLCWSREEEAWVGEYRGFRYSLAYQGHASPAEAVVEYAAELMSDPGWLERALSEAREAALREYGPQFAAEIRSLTFGMLYFNLHQGTPRLFAELEGGDDFHFWRIEFSDRRCDGIGFDD